MNKWLVGVGLVGVLLMIIGYFSTWATQYTEIGGETIVTSLSGNHLYFGFSGSLVLMFGLSAMFCIFGAAICPTGGRLAIVSKIMGVFVTMCGVIILIGLADAFRSLQAWANLSPLTTIHYDYGFILSAVGGVLVLLAGIFGMFPIEPSTKSQRLLS